MPSRAFPVAILQNGVKMTLEPPKGLKANMKNAYFKLDDDKINITNKPFQYKKLLFALCFFHASVQDRRKYGPLGWNIPYAFNDTDLEISKAQLENFLNRYEEVPYTVLNKMTSYINYGGRVTDYIDLRTIDVLLRDLFRAEIMTDDYKFSRSGVYYSLPVNDDSPHAAYVEYIDSLPLNSNPEAFGMHDNAAIICAETETTETYDTILSLQAKVSSSDGLSPEEILDALAEDIMNDVAEQYDIESVSMVYPLAYNESMNTVLVQELMRYNKLIHAIRSTLPVMRKALKGLVVMSVELEAMSKALTVQKIPDLWQAHAYPSLKPLGPWVVELKQRITFLQDWIDNGIPSVFWIPGFFFPQAFMTGNLQNYARKYTLPIDTISFNFEWKKELKAELPNRPEDGCYIDGLYLEGARFDKEKGHLEDSLPKQLYTLAPVFHLQPEQNRKPPKGGIYRTPVYKTLRRAGTLSTTGHSTNFVLWMELPGGRDDFTNNLGMADQDYWIKAGVAMFCSLRY
jgi:dynein heavy chain